MTNRILAVPLVVALAGGFMAWRATSPRMGAPEEPGAFGSSPGELVPDFRYKPVEGPRRMLSDLLEDHDAVVIAMRTAGCPVSLKYGHVLAALEKEYAAKGVAFVYLNIGPQDDEAAIRKEIETFGFSGPYVSDPDADIGKLLQVRVSSEVFVIDRARTMRYRGAVDDQFGITFAKPEVRERYLRDALDAVLSGHKVDVPETEASGCYLELPGETRVPLRSITWNNRISRLAQDNCVTCHRTDGVAPFSLETYETAFGFRGMIRNVVETKRMPPWFASPEHGEWKNDRTLSERDRRDLLAWIDDGAPEGDAATAALQYQFVNGWQLTEEPDAIVEIPEVQPVPASGVVDYRYVYVQTHFDTDMWIQQAEPRPTALQQTHHIIVYLVEGPGDEGGSFLVGTAPGMPATTFPEGSGKKLPKDAWLKFELHYTTNGTAAEDRSRVAFVFADGRPEMEVATSAVATQEFEIPARASNHEVVAEQKFRRSGQIIALLPHMHLRGKSFRYELIQPDGSMQVLLDVPKYDFNWQLWYQPTEPIRVQAGTVLRGIAHYDNSAGNPANPDPDHPVTYGQQSWEEMMFGFYDWIPDRVVQKPAVGARTGASQ